MNEIQSVEFDLLKCFISICDNLDLKYYLVCGSALGAVRHGGFIPWDDDLDVSMPREDYNIFMKCAQSYLPEGVFLQNFKTDANYPLFYAKLRNSNTTAIESYYKNIEINQGLFIDIFPLDGYPSNESEQKKLESKIKRYKKLSRCGLTYSENLSFKSRLALKIRKILRYHKRTGKILAKYEATVSKYPVNNSKLICNYGTPYGKNDYMPNDYYDEGVSVSFEGIEVIVPKKYDEYLTALYGDWQTLPPIEERFGKHLFEICDTKISYRNYLSNSTIKN